MDLTNRAVELTARADVAYEMKGKDGMAETRLRAATLNIAAATLLVGIGVSYRNVHAQGPVQSGSTTQNSISILFHSDPNPLKVGKNNFEVLVKDAEKAVKDAEVTLVFEMSGASGPATTKRTVVLKYRAAGIYRGLGEVTIPGNWSLTIVVKRQGREPATRELALVVK